MYRDLAGFDFSAFSTDTRLVRDLASLAFMDTALNVVFIGGPGTGKTHLVTVLVVSGIIMHYNRARF
ncbi:IstB-like ATP binding protein [Pseudomonas sp. NFIX28]|nr:IstB-like ATP binding protein [Pseudomonas sp. NFIX28]